MLITVTGRMVRSHGEGETALPDSGRVILTPLAHGVWEGALRGRESVTMRIVDGAADPVDLTPGPWKVWVDPEHGPSWDSWQVELEPGMPEPVDLAALAPVVVVDGEKWAQGPAGASVTGGRDNGDGTVSFELSDGTFTDPVTVPPGPAGRGIASISDPDTDSLVTIVFTDGTTATVQAIRGSDGHTPEITWEGTSIVVDGEQGPDLKGEPGADSTVPGPAPTVSWDGDRLVVEGVTGPSLTGPDGPAPTVAWSGDRLVVGGVQGPSLTGPASTVPGPPGAVPTASDYLVVGPGRPDAPTTTGLSSAQIAALPVGCEYRSTDGASVGAWVWTKRPSGWVVTEGDTGWLSITLGAPYSAGTTIRVRRTAELVYAAHGTPEAFATWNPGVAKTTSVAIDKAWNGTASFTPDRRAVALIFNGGTGATVGAVGWSTEADGFVGLTHTVTSGMVFELQAACTRTWPTTLPGAPA